MPFTARGGGEVDLGLLRERLHATMWDDAGIVRNAESLARAEAALAGLHAEHQAYALPSPGAIGGSTSPGTTGSISAA